MTLSSKNRLYAYIGVSITIIGLACFLSWFLFNLIIRTGVDVQKAQSELATLTMRQEHVNAITKKYEIAKNTFSPLKETLLSREERLQFIILVEQLAAQSAVSHTIETGEDAVGDNQEKKAGSQTAKINSVFHFNVNASGSFTNIMRFMYLLENSKYNLVFEKVNLAGGGGERSVISHDANALTSLSNVKAQIAIAVFAR